MASANDGITTRKLRGAGGVAELAAAWRSLQDAVQPSPMARLEWVQAYAETYAARRQDALRITVVERNGAVVGIAPMVSYRKSGVRSLESVGVRELYEPTDLLYRDEAALRALLAALLRQRVPIVFERLPLHVATLELLQNALNRRGVVLQRPRVSCPYVVLGSTPDSLLNSGRRSDLRRARRRAEQIGPVKIEILTPRAEDLPRLLEVAFKIEAAGWKGRNDSALLCESDTRNFFDRYAVHAANSGILRLALMHIGATPAAMQFAVECSGSFWLLKIGYDEEFSSCSPGNILMWEALTYAIGRGLGTCEFLGSAAPWTKHWTQLERPTARVVGLPIGWSPAVFLAQRAFEKFKESRENKK